MAAWIGVDLDGTLAHYEHGDGVATIGKPIQRMVDRIKQWHRQGMEVRIITARVGACQAHNDDGVHDNEEFAEAQRRMIQEWCTKHIGFPLPVTCSKDFEMIEMWDDRAIQCVPNTGLSLIEHQAR